MNSTKIAITNSRGKLRKSSIYDHHLKFLISTAWGLEVFFLLVFGFCSNSVGRLVGAVPTRLAGVWPGIFSRRFESPSLKVSNRPRSEMYIRIVCT